MIQMILIYENNTCKTRRGCECRLALLLQNLVVAKKSMKKAMRDSRMACLFLSKTRAVVTKSHRNQPPSFFRTRPFSLLFEADSPFP